MRPTWIAVPCAETGTWEEEMGWDSLLAEGGTDVHLIECRAESEWMSPDTTEAATQEVEIMDVEPQGEVAGELAGLDAQVPSLQAHPRAVKQSGNEEMTRDPGASAVEDGHTPESLVLGKPVADGSLMEKDVAVEEPMVEVPPTREEPAALPRCAHGPWTPKKKTKWKSTPLKWISMTGDGFMV